MLPLYYIIGSAIGIVFGWLFVNVVEALAPDADVLIKLFCVLLVAFTGPFFAGVVCGATSD